MKTFKQILTEAAKKATGKKVLSDFPMIHHCVAANRSSYLDSSHEDEHKTIERVTVPKPKHADYKKTETYFKKRVGDVDPEEFFAKAQEEGDRFPPKHEEVLDHAHALTYSKDK